MPCIRRCKPLHTLASLLAGARNRCPSRPFSSLRFWPNVISCFALTASILDVVHYAFHPPTHYATPGRTRAARREYSLGSSLHRREPCLRKAEGGVNDWRPAFAGAPYSPGLGWQADVSDSCRISSRLCRNAHPHVMGVATFQICCLLR